LGGRGQDFERFWRQGIRPAAVGMRKQNVIYCLCIWLSVIHYSDVEIKIVCGAGKTGKSGEGK
jgi:hypothetical protein